MTPTFRDSRRPFAKRRELILGYLDQVLELRERLTYEEFTSDWVYATAVAKQLEAIGELMHPNAGHATRETAQKFHAARNEIAHEYSTYPVKAVWDVMDKLGQLKEEVLERTEPSP